MTIAAEPTQESTARLKRELKVADAKKRAMALLLIAPLAIFLFLIFVVPIGALLTRAAENPEVATALPHTGTALAQWDRKTPPPDAAYAALAQDLTAIQDGESMGALARRLNTEIPGYRSLVAKTARAMPLTGDDGKPLAAPQIRAKIVELDERWGDVAYWQAIAKNAGRYSPFYLLAALDHRQDGFGNIEHSDPDQSIYLNIFERTFVIGVVVTFFAPAARLSARLLDFDAARAQSQPRDDARADPVLDVDPRARRRVDRAAAKRRAGEQGADRRGSDRPAVRAAVQPHRRATSR